ncbi:DNA recombination protein RmuC [Hyphococcus sp.]|uniref:DNA recombination protein RmuC n=1 Tax=Hyphococcus sp. TaxID=2038636 RepID=UPI0035C6BE13
MIYDFLNDAGLPPDGPAFWLILFLFIAAVFFILQARRASKRAGAHRSDLEEARITLAKTQEQLAAFDAVRDELAHEKRQREQLQSDVAVGRATIEERERALAELKTRMETEFKATTAQLLEGANEAFLKRAAETFQRYSENAKSDGEKRQKALDDLLKPVSETLVRYQKGLDELRKEQTESRGALVSQIGELAKQTHDVRAEAQKLATALRAGPKTRGRWGEEQLRNVVEIAGMSAYVDFVEQASHDDSELRRKQPDMVVRLPGGRVVAVDSKVSLGAYLDAIDAEAEDARAAHLARHADDLWKHVKSLSAKDYAASLKDSLDYVVMFVPGENYFSAALEARPQLYQDAFDRKILIASPTILIAMLKSAALNWRQEKMTENAQAVAAMAKDLYDSLSVMSKNLGGVGKALSTAIGKYNATVGGFESRVLSRARKFAEYEIPGVETDIETLAPVEETPRLLRDVSGDLFDDDDDGSQDAA